MDDTLLDSMIANAIVTIQTSELIQSILKATHRDVAKKALDHEPFNSNAFKNASWKSACLPNARIVESPYLQHSSIYLKIHFSCNLEI